jgi:hypothetical protein
MLGSPAPLGDQFVNQRAAGLDMFSHQLAGTLNLAAHRCDPQFVILDSQDEFVARSDAQRFTQCSRYHDSAILVDRGTNLIHVTISVFDILPLA